MSPQLLRGVVPTAARSRPNCCEESPPTAARSHPNRCEESPQPLRGVTPTAARSHPNRCEESPQPLRGVTPTAARSHPNHCEESAQPLRGVTPTTARSHPNHCEESPQPLRGVTPTTARSHPNHCEDSLRKWRDGGVAPHQFFKNNSVWDVIYFYFRFFRIIDFGPILPNVFYKKSEKFDFWCLATKMTSDFDSLCQKPLIKKIGVFFFLNKIINLSMFIPRFISLDKLSFYLFF